jgi:hypothetical protein
MADSTEGLFKTIFFIAIFLGMLVVIAVFLFILKILLIFTPEIHLFGLNIRPL